MLAAAQAARLRGERVGLVPTMGFLHAGHLSLVDEARRRCDVVVMSIFVNPTQFAPTEDLSTYPRDLARDTAMAESAGVDMLYVPEAADLYPTGFDTFIVPGAAGAILEGAVRPTHFRGVLTVVAKLFHMTAPNVAVFGQKDFQQALLIRKMVRDLNFDVEIIVAPIMREPDGLAMSSRNIYLTPSQREQARALSASLTEAQKMIADGERNSKKIIDTMSARIAREPEAHIDYILVAGAETLQAIEEISPTRSAVIALAVRVGKTRLLDNCIIAT